jgi:hypothetical protein
MENANIQQILAYCAALDRNAQADTDTEATVPELGSANAVLHIMKYADECVKTWETEKVKKFLLRCGLTNATPSCRFRRLDVTPWCEIKSVGDYVLEANTPITVGYVCLLTVRDVKTDKTVSAVRIAVAKKEQVKTYLEDAGINANAKAKLELLKKVVKARNDAELEATMSRLTGKRQTDANVAQWRNICAQGSWSVYETTNEFDPHGKPTVYLNYGNEYGDPQVDVDLYAKGDFLCSYLAISGRKNRSHKFSLRDSSGNRLEGEALERALLAFLAEKKPSGGGAVDVRLSDSVLSFNSSRGSGRRADAEQRDSSRSGRSTPSSGGSTSGRSTPSSGGSTPRGVGSSNGRGGDDSGGWAQKPASRGARGGRGGGQRGRGRGARA